MSLLGTALVKLAVMFVPQTNELPQEYVGLNFSQYVKFL